MASAFAREQADCQPQIQNIHVAKGTGVKGDDRPLSTDWQSLSHLPDYWNKRWEGYSGSVWYRLVWRYDCPLDRAEPMMLTVSFMNMAGQVFINDQILWQSKSLDEPLSRNWNNPRRWMLPIGVLKSGENTVLIRVKGLTELNPGIGTIHLGDYRSITDIYEKSWLDTRGLYSYTICFEIVLCLFSMFIWILRPSEKVFGWYALISLFWIAYLSMKLVTEPLLGLSTLNMARLETYILFCFTSLSCIYPWRFANAYFPKLEKTFFILLVIFAFCLLLTPDHAIKIVLEMVSIIGILIYLSNCAFYPILAIRSKQKEAYVMAFILFAIYLPVALHDGYQVINYRGVMWAVYSTPITAILLAYIFALRLTTSLNRIESFNQTLTIAVVKAKQELGESLQARHQLELENVKLQERIHLAHDLHDGLGGTLVRSMVSVEHSKVNLTNPQFLSMLKHLRDDLRQIVDYGSSIAKQTPETPRLWLAPIRYRFNQFFDELGVSCVWDIPEIWDVAVTSTDCLAYQRVIEESLTNIIKHSHAHHVNVQLKMVGKSLSLVIEDDGTGFDVASVYGSGLSIGLRSMQTRLEKINATFQVISIVGQTRIEVRKNYL